MPQNPFNVYFNTALSDFLFSATSWDSNIDGGGWTLIRHVPRGNNWYRATDQLRGTDVYGTPCGAKCNKEWSIKFSNQQFDQFLFATGDGKKWLIADKNAVTGGWYGCYFLSGPYVYSMFN